MQIVYLSGGEAFVDQIPDLSIIRLNYFQQICELSDVVVVSTSKSDDSINTSGKRFKVRIRPDKTRGALVSATFALGDLPENEPFLIIPSNSIVPPQYLLDFEEKMRDQGAAAGVLVFQSEDSMFSYARKDKNNRVIEVLEKQVSGDCALAGYYYFNSPKTFRDCALWALVNNVTTKGLFYLSPALNYFLAAGMEIGLFDIPTDAYLRLDSGVISKSTISRWDELYANI